MRSEMVSRLGTRGKIAARKQPNGRRDRSNEEEGRPPSHVKSDHATQRQTDDHGNRRSRDNQSQCSRLRSLGATRTASGETIDQNTACAQATPIREAISIA